MRTGLDRKATAKKIAEKVNLYRINDGSTPNSQVKICSILREMKCTYYIEVVRELIRKSILIVKSSYKNKSGLPIKMYVFADKSKPIDYAFFFETILRARGSRRGSEKKQYTNNKEKDLSLLSILSDDELIKELICVRNLNIIELYPLITIINSLKSYLTRVTVWGNIVNDICAAFTEKQLVEHLRKRGVNIEATIKL